MNESRGIDLVENEFENGNNESLDYLMDNYQMIVEFSEHFVFVREKFKRETADIC